MKFKAKIQPDIFNRYCVEVLDQNSNKIYESNFFPSVTAATKEAVRVAKTQENFESIDVKMLRRRKLQSTC
ncbi:MAG: hypothetical protein ABIQ35_09020 [Verrucomicrobiota bacterium]